MWPRFRPGPISSSCADSCGVALAIDGHRLFVTSEALLVTGWRQPQISFSERFAAIRCDLSSPTVRPTLLTHLLTHPRPGLRTPLESRAVVGPAALPEGLTTYRDDGIVVVESHGRYPRRRRPRTGEFNGTPPDRAKDDDQHLGDGTTPAVVDVIADARERPSDTFEALRARPDVVLTVATLKYGDYSVASQLSIEPKAAGPRTLDHRRQAVPADGRSSTLRGETPAARRRSSAAQHTIGTSWHTVRGALVSVAVVFGVPILLAAEPQESAEILVTAGRPLAQLTSLVPCQARLPA